MTAKEGDNSWFERRLRQMQDRQHYTSGILALLSFCAGILLSFKDAFTWSTFLSDLYVSVVISIGNFIMCEMFITTLELRANLQQVRDGLPQELVKQTETAVNQIVNNAKTAIEKKEHEVENALSQVINRSSDAAAPHLKLAFDPKPEEWLRLFASISTGAGPGITQAAGAVTRAPRGISCNVFCLDVQRYADVAEILLDGARKSVESTTYYPNHDLVELLANTGSEVRDWITKVNKWASTDLSRSVTRIHLLEPDDQPTRTCNGEDALCLQLRSTSQFLSLLEGNQSAKQFYVEQYASIPDLKDRFTFHACELPEGRNGTPLLPPECIVLDRQVALMYDPRFCQLKLFFGDIAREMGGAFDEARRRNSWSVGMENYLAEVARSA